MAIDVEPSSLLKTPTRSGVLNTWRRASQEATLMIGLFLLYELGRLAAADDPARALHNGRVMNHLERWLHLPSEVATQSHALAIHGLIRSADNYYSLVHFPLTAAALIWLFLRRPTYYRWARRSIVISTGVALAIHLLIPTAPPRMFVSLGFTDTARVHGESVYGTHSIGNAYAALPSLHVGWALLLAIVLISASATTWRWLWGLYPITTFAVVVITANHWWLDGVAGSVLVVLVLILVRDRAAQTRRTDPRRSLQAESRVRPLPSVTPRHATSMVGGSRGDRVLGESTLDDALVVKNTLGLSPVTLLDIGWGLAPDRVPTHLRAEHGLPQRWASGGSSRT